MSASSPSSGSGPAPGPETVPPTVLIAGAGPTGLACALQLHRHGAGVRIVDRAEARTALSKAVGINAHTLDLLEPTGACEALLDQGKKIRAMNVRQGVRRVVRLDFSNMPHRHDYLLALPQSETVRILEETLAGRGIAVERETELESFVQDRDGVVARLSSRGATAEHRSDFLAGCDGAHSTVRKALDIGFSGERYPDRWSLVDLHMDWPFGDDEANLFMGRGGELLFVIPMPGGRFRAISNTADALALLPPGTDPGVVVWQSEFTVSLRQVATYQMGRVFLAGDAAHIHSPAGGQGMNLGIEDASVFAYRAVHGGLERYSADRHPLGARVVADSDRMFRMAALANPVLCAMRNAMLRVVASRAFVQRRMLSRIAGLDHPSR